LTGRDFTAGDFDAYGGFMTDMLSEGRAAATVVILRDRPDAAAEILMMERASSMVFDLPPTGPTIITRVCRFDIRAAPPAQARRV
jgi:hypothetical protein